MLLDKVDTEGGKPENPEKNRRSTGETNYNNTTHMSSKLFFENLHEAIPRCMDIPSAAQLILVFGLITYFHIVILTQSALCLKLQSVMKRYNIEYRYLYKFKYFI